METVTRTHRPAEQRRDEITAAALRILAEDGLHALTTAALARRVGLSEASLFRHFRSKEDILLAAVRGAAESLHARIRDYRGEGDAWERARGLMLELLTFMEETGGAPMVVLSGHVVRVSPEVRAAAVGVFALLRERMTALFAEAQPAGVSRVSPEVLADLAIAVMQSAGARWMLSGRQVPLKPTATAMFDVLRRCMAA
jgi:AcrR family transcriptional regulator